MENKELKGKIKKILAEFLGVEESDISDDDDFVTDLLMEPSSIFDFQEKLNASEIEAAHIDFKEIHSIDDLMDALEGAVIDHVGHQTVDE